VNDDISKPENTDEYEPLSLENDDVATSEGDQKETELSLDGDGDAAIEGTSFDLVSEGDADDNVTLGDVTIASTVDPTTDVMLDDDVLDVEATEVLPGIAGGKQGMSARKNSDIEMDSSAQGHRGGAMMGGHSVPVNVEREISSRLGDRLIELGVLTSEQLAVALQEKKISGKMLGQVLVDLEFIDDQILSQVLAEAAGHEVFDPKNTIVDGAALALMDRSIAEKMNVLPVSIGEDEICVAMTDPHDVVAMDSLRRYIPKGLIVKPLVTTPTILSEAIDAAYGYSNAIDDILKELEQQGDDIDVAELTGDGAYTHPIVRLVNALVFDAVKTGVSDLHFEPEENFCRLRFRLDGVLFTAYMMHKKHWNGMSQRIKLMSNMNIADKLSPQDGRFHINVGGREADFRVSSLPTVHGENIVLRVLDKSSSIMPLEGLGFSAINREKIAYCQTKPEGIIIVTGPTGSGKSTSLYSMLNHINSVEVNIQTLEDPVEYTLPMIRQTNVREGVLEFSDGIKAMLRQDPDIIFIGEVRDQTTAEMALKAAMTGHQVYTTLHTNDSFGALPRLMDLNIKPGMLAGSIIGVFAQRLARRLCSSCRVPYRASDEECKYLGVEPSDPPEIFKANEKGCPMCMGKGYKGRIALAEILTFDEDLDDLVASNAPKSEIRKLAFEKGFKSMKDDGMLKILEGITDFAAVSKVANIDKD
jgi:general secretion pathway protein E/type IV pilus assembly protein PilB